MFKKKTLTPQEALARLTALCAGSEQCEYKMREKLEKWGIPASDANPIIDYLYDENYLNESRFAHAYSRDKMRYNQWGRQKIEQNLRMLHIASTARHEALEDLPEEEYTEILRHLLNVKAHSIKADSEYERNGKLIRFALGRGFEMDAILEAISTLQT